MGCRGESQASKAHMAVGTHHRSLAERGQQPWGRWGGMGHHCMVALGGDGRVFGHAVPPRGLHLPCGCEW